MFCAKCGKPLDAGARFCSFCGTVTQGSVPPPFGGPASRGQLVRSRSRRIIAGVCGGFADHYGWDLNIVRILTAVLVLFTGLPLLVYVILWVVIPDGQYALPFGSPIQPPPAPGPAGDGTVL